MSKAMSYNEVITKVLAGEPVTDEMRERLEALKVQLAKRSSGRSTKVQNENAAICDEIMSCLEAGVVYSLVDVANAVPSLNGKTTQKVGPLCRKLAADGKLVETHKKGKAFYELALGGDAE